MINPNCTVHSTKFDDMTNCFSWSIIASISNTTAGQDIFWTSSVPSIFSRKRRTVTSTVRNITSNHIPTPSQELHHGSLDRHGSQGDRATQPRDESSPPLCCLFEPRKRLKECEDRQCTISVSASFQTGGSAATWTTQQGFLHALVIPD